MAETLTVALRVAEEAIEEAISKAEEFSDSLEKQNEARYLRDHKEDLIEELATTIVQKIIQRRKRSVMQSDYEFVWPLEAPALSQASEAPPSLAPPPVSTPGGTQDPMHTPYSLWRSRSALSLTSDDSMERGPGEQQASAPGAERGPPQYSSLKREPKATSLPSWKSVDRLDNSSASSVLQSPDGNWIALQSAQLARPSLLAKRKSLVFSALEKESDVVSAYDGMGSESGGDNNNDNHHHHHHHQGGGGVVVDEGGWGAALLQFHRKMSDETYFTDSQHDPEWTFTRHPAQPPPSPPPSSPPPTSSHQHHHHQHHHQHLPNQRRTPPPYEPHHAHPHPQQQSTDDGVFHQAHHHHHHHRRHLHEDGTQLPPEALDVNFNPKVTGDSSEAEERPSDPVRRSRRRRKSKREPSCSTSHSIHPLIRENSGILLSALLKRSLSQEQSAGPPSPPAPAPPPPGAPEPPAEEVFFSSSPEVTERDPDAAGTGPPPDSLALGPPPPRTPAGPGPSEEGPPEEELRRPPEEELRRPPEEELRRPPVRSEHPEQKPAAGQRDRQDEEEREEEEDNGGKREEPGSVCERLSEDNMAAQHGGQAQGQSTEPPVDGSERDRRGRPAAGGQVTGEEEEEEEEEAEGVAGVRRERTSGSENGGTEGLLTDHRRHHHDADLQRGKRPEKGGPGGRRPSKRQQRRGVEKKKETADADADATAAGLSGSSASTSSCSPAVTPSALQEVLSDGQQGQPDSELQQSLDFLSQQQQKYSAASLCSITTEVLKVLNATEELIGEAGRGDSLTTPSESMSPSPMSSCSDNTRLDQRLTKMEENVYLAASAVYGLEGALGDLEECARGISSGTTDTELAFLEDQVATAAAQVHHSELQISNIEARISALKTAGLNVTTCHRFSKYKPKPQTLDSSRHQRRKLPAPPLKDKLDQEQQALRP